MSGSPPDLPDVLARLQETGDPAAMKGRARFGIPEEGFGVSLPKLRRLAKELGHDAPLARGLWASGVHDARLLATLVMPPDALAREEAEAWLADVRSWDLCDGVCLNVVDKTAWAWDAAVAWVARPEEWVKRAGFATMAGLALHRKDAPDARVAALLPALEAHADDERNFVKKAASWALRQAGKRSAGLRRKALAVARRLEKSPGKGARWVGRDARKELEARATE